VRFVTVEGHPAPKGSKRHVGRGRLIEQSKLLPAWQQRLREALADEMFIVDRQHPVELHVWFTMPRPKSRKHRHPYHVVTPDLDKLVRAVADELTGTLIHDDGQVCRIRAEKTVAPVGDAWTGCQIMVRRLDMENM